ncbi:MAG: hypothetical protein RR620_13180 [Clostridium sp.]
MREEILNSLKGINCLEEDFGNEVSCCFEDVENEIIVSDLNTTNNIDNIECEVYSVHEDIEGAEEFILYVNVTIDEETEEKNIEVIEVN